MPAYAGKALRFASKGCHSSPGLKAWGFLACFINIVYRQEKEWFVGHIQEYPDYESQGRSLEELRDNLIEIYDDIRKGLVPDAEPFQILEVAI